MGRSKLERDRDLKRCRLVSEMARAEPEDPCFLKVQCEDCENKQVVFSHSSKEVNCEVCGKTLVTPQGGKAEIETKILEIVG